MAGEELVQYTLAANPGVPPLPRAGLYRELTRNIQREILEVAFPRTRKVLGEEGLEALLEAFLEERGPRTLQVPCVPDDLVAWALGASHPYADLLDFERSSVRAERHPATIDFLRAPEAGRPVALNPTLQVSAYARPVHEITLQNPDPPRGESLFVYLAWRRPVSDEIARQRVGVVVGRSLGLLGEESLTREQWFDGALARVPERDRGVLGKTLTETFEALVARSGIVAAFLREGP